jgi:putative quorum-sensing-regulated virulence factor
MRERKMIMPYGQYKGWDIEDVPTEYLKFILSEAEITCAMVPRELERRKQRSATSAPGKASEDRDLHL